MIENKIKLNIISNRKLCENENFEIVSLTLREKDLELREVKDYH